MIWYSCTFQNSDTKLLGKVAIMKTKKNKCLRELNDYVMMYFGVDMDKT